MLVNYLNTSGIAYSNQNLQSETYNTSWANLTSDVNAMATMYVMGEITADDWNAFVKDIVESSDYQAILAEYAASAK